MVSDVLPEPGSAFGQRVRRRLREDPVIWLTTVGVTGFSEDYSVALRIRTIRVRGI